MSFAQTVSSPMLSEAILNPPMPANISIALNFSFLLIATTLLRGRLIIMMKLIHPLQNSFLLMSISLHDFVRFFHLVCNQQLPLYGNRGYCIFSWWWKDWLAHRATFLPTSQSICLPWGAIASCSCLCLSTFSRDCYMSRSCVITPLSWRILYHFEWAEVNIMFIF